MYNDVDWYKDKVKDMQNQIEYVRNLRINDSIINNALGLYIIRLTDTIRVYEEMIKEYDLGHT